MWTDPFLEVSVWSLFVLFAGTLFTFLVAILLFMAPVLMVFSILALVLVRVIFKIVAVFNIVVRALSRARAFMFLATIGGIYV